MKKKADRTIFRYIKQSTILFPAIVFLAALATRLTYIFQTGESPLGNYLVVDSKFYHDWALEIYRGEWLSGQVFPMSPLYSYWLAAMFTLFTKNLFFIKCVQAALGSLACLILYSFTKNVTSDRRTGLIAGFIGAFYGPFIFYDAMIMKTFLAVILTLLTAWFLSIGGRRALLHSFSGGIFLASAALVRENITLLIPFLLIWLICSSPETRIFKKSRRALAFTAGFFLIISPITIRNFMISGEFVLITAVGGENFYLGNNPDTDGYYRPPGFIAPNPLMEHENWRQKASELLGREVSAKESSDFWFSRGIRFILTEPVKFLKLTFNKMILFWNFYEAPDNYNYYFWQELSPLLRSFTINFGFVAPLALTGIFLSLGRANVFMLPYIIFFGYMGSFLIFFNLSRYRLPAVPFAILFAAYTVNWFFTKLIAGKYKAPLLAAPLTVLFLVLCNTTTEGVLHFAKDCDECYARLGSAYADDMDYAKAEAAYSTAIKLDPGFANNRNGLGMLYLSQGKLRLAESEFKAAIRIRPTLGEAYYNLATTYMSQNRLDDAIAGFRLALKRTFVPYFLVSIHNNLGNALARNGHPEQAVDEYRQALKIDPYHKNANKNLKIMLNRKTELLIKNRK